ncbi:his Kinase A domain protein, partial [Vibrio cholerae HC-17A2]|jgi:hypothetical protein
LTSE